MPPEQANAPGFLARLFRPKVPLLPKRRDRSRSSDLVIAALGITLGLICALFPWYIFFNQEKFGIKAIRFEGGHEASTRGPLVSGGGRIGAPMGLAETLAPQLDFLATGTTAAPQSEAAAPAELPPQPFPVEPPVFHLVHVANNRAMLEDDSGLFVVGRGSVLPDGSRVQAIEPRGKRWVLVTSENKVLEIQD